MSLFPHEELSVPLHVPAAEFIASLKADLAPSRLTVATQGGFVGRVTGSDVRIRWARKFYSNDLSPTFEGAISPDQRFVRGVFRQRRWVLRLVLVSTAFAVAAVVAELLRGSAPGPVRSWLFILPLAFLALAIVLPWLAWFLGRADIERITSALRAAARGESVPPSKR